MARSRPFRIYFYRTARGECPVRDFLRGLPVKDRRKCFYYLDRIQASGIQQSKNFVEKLDDNLWEAKPEYNNVEYRFLFGFIGPNRIGMVTALKKKRMRLPRAVLGQAMKLIAEMHA